MNFLHLVKYLLKLKKSSCSTWFLLVLAALCSLRLEQLCSLGLVAETQGTKIFNEHLKLFFRFQKNLKSKFFTLLWNFTVGKLRCLLKAASKEMLFLSGLNNYLTEQKSRRFWFSIELFSSDLEAFLKYDASEMLFLLRRENAKQIDEFHDKGKPFWVGVGSFGSELLLPLNYFCHSPTSIR